MKNWKVALAVALITGPALAAEHYIISPAEGKPEAIAKQVELTLQAAALPQGEIGMGYSYNLGPLLTVTGDENYKASFSRWAAAGLPAGMTLSERGILAGTPQAEGDHTFGITASYLSKSVTQLFTLPVTAGYGTVFGFSSHPLSNGNLDLYSWTGQYGGSTVPDGGPWAVSRDGHSRGKWYFEIAKSGNGYLGAGVTEYSGGSPGRAWLPGAYWEINHNILGIAVDFDAGKMYGYVGCNPTPKVVSIPAGVTLRAVAFGGGGGQTLKGNFGQKPFTCQVPAGYTPGF